MKPKIEISYSLKYDETKIKPSDHFEKLDILTKLDILSDAITLVTDFYNQTLQNWEEVMKKHQKTPKTLKNVKIRNQKT